MDQNSEQDLNVSASSFPTKFDYTLTAHDIVRVLLDSYAITLFMVGR